MRRLERRVEELDDPRSPVPHALVTPRMLWAVYGHDAEGRSTLCRVEQPS
ncbi:hypothetical protein [Actinomycetospora chibensis]|uniref:Uncharacterized protein n=1 Tax=Actinomycetospora chibensis TaxID=663606 RepID=A0ABV9RLI5_9PSEU|nr:hypothetical protein [Actinomycetospora chibensis]MDD7927216.1 hypothetical protein [Actinomycetospora chibensis]